MDQLHTRLDALEQQMHTVTRRLRWWRGLACGAVVLAMLTWALPAVLAQEEDAKGKGPKGLAQRVAALEELLKHFSREKNEIFITGANLYIVNGLGQTSCADINIPDCPNGMGNLIVGYNELREGGDVRTGSHNVVLGSRNNFSRIGGLVVGNFNEISGDFAVISGGEANTASSDFASVSGGFDNIASGFAAAVSGGRGNVASGPFAAVSGGGGNTASGAFASVSGGSRNIAFGDSASISGGGNFFPDVGNMAGGEISSVSGGKGNTAAGRFSSVSGGFNRTAEGEFDWVAGSLFEDE
jgi:hypothetical protein